MRGTLRGYFYSLSDRGIIPACAGNTASETDITASRRDHPRVCGEHAALHGQGDGGLGIIPACAGNTASRRRCPKGSWDHPRVCGEHSMVVMYPSPGWGSSPRVRGTLCPCRKNHYVTGIIPACAGNTPRPRHVGRMGRDHPRVCGEHASAVSTASPSSGSSPRVRGTLLAQVRVRGEGGIIPACAGNTMTSRCPARSAWDHPRVCGEHHGEQRVHDRGKGSSPRVRGTLPVDCLVAQVVGIIPACAGNTNVGLKSNNTSGDHPRVCGEHVRLTSLGL